MTTITRTLARYIALPAVSAGILGGAALGLAGMANAGTYSYTPSPRPGIVAGPERQGAAAPHRDPRRPVAPRAQPFRDQPVRRITPSPPPQRPSPAA